MATSGAFNGTDVFMRVLIASTGAWLPLGGQVSHTETITNALVDVTNKIGSPKFRELLPDEGIQNVDYSVELVFNSQSGFEFVRSMAGTRAITDFQIVKGDVDVGVTGVVMTSVRLMVSSFVDTSGNGEALKASVGFLSSDLFEWDRNQSYDIFLTSAGDNLLTSTGDKLIVEA
jgi:predicted secreted protein